MFFFGIFMTADIDKSAMDVSVVQDTSLQSSAEVESIDKKSKEKVNEIGGPKGPEPTRFGDWERKGRCVDF